MKAIRMHQVGGPEVLKYEDCADPSPGPGEALIGVQAIGVNFFDVYIRSGAMPLPNLPVILGGEAAGVVLEIGEGVTEIRAGDIVGYSGVPSSYAERVAAPEKVLVKIPSGLDAKTGAAVLLQGMTAHYLAYSTYPFKHGDGARALVHAGAGGVGLLLIQMLKRAGAYVIATVSTDEKAALAKEVGADRAIVYTREDFEREVKAGTGGEGVQVVYDGVAKTTFEKSLNCLAPRGYMVLYGEASGPVPTVDIPRLNADSLFVTRPNLNHYTRDREELLWRAGEVMGWVASGELKLHIGGTFPLAEAVEAHRQLEGRRSTGKLLLIP